MSDVIPWKWRPDLQARPHEGGGWVVNDPLNAEYTFLNDHEYFAAVRLTGGVTGAAWQATLQQQFPEFSVTAEQLKLFLQRLIQQQLVLGTSFGSSAPVLQRRSRVGRRSWISRLSSLFSLQIPLVDPTPFLNRIQPWTSLLFTRTAFLLISLLLILAAGLTVLHFEDFRRSLPDLASLVTRDHLPVFVIIFCIVKALHELGHAVVCHHCGARCRSCGIMFLIFTPVLFTDVSDSWTLSRRQRMAVTAAGIVVELSIAALCMIAWCGAAEGAVRNALTSTILLCTVTTVLFNANPLLRFDGYFLLADFVAIPNLYQRGSERAGQFVRRLMFGLSTRSTDTFLKARSLVTLYGLAALGYRVFVSLAIIKLVLTVAHSQQQQALGMALSAFVFLSFLALPLMTFLKTTWSLSEAAGRRSSTALRLVVIAAVLLLLLKFEYPRQVNAVCVVVPDGEAVYVTEPGELDSFANYGTELKANQPLATLTDMSTQIAVVRLQSELSQQQILLEELKRLPATAAPRDLATAQEAVAALQEQLKAVQRKASKLQITTPVSGILLPPAPVPDATSTAELQGWHGLPLQLENQHAFLERGTMLGYVGRPDVVKVLAFIPEEEAAYVLRGASAEMFPGNGQISLVHTTVTDMGAVDSQQVPAQLMQRGLLPAPNQRDAVFRATLLSEEQTNNIQPPYYTVGRVKISGRPVSVGQRLAALLRRHFPAFFGH